jgi:hypothetical protein
MLKQIMLKCKNRFDKINPGQLLWITKLSALFSTIAYNKSPTIGSYIGDICDQPIVLISVLFYTGENRRVYVISPQSVGWILIDDNFFSEKEEQLS